MLGGILAMLIIILFLRNVRGTLIIVVAIPLSILITFILFRFGGITLNIMTFGGLALAVGRLVDDSIVELEAISRHYNMRKKGQSKLDATLDAAREVASPIFVSTLTTVIVFLPVVFLSGIAKLLFIPLTITIAVALFGSFFVSRTHIDEILRSNESPFLRYSGTDRGFLRTHAPVDNAQPEVYCHQHSFVCSLIVRVDFLYRDGIFSRSRRKQIYHQLQIACRFPVRGNGYGCA
jgi:hypothetical protein